MPRIWVVPIFLVMDHTMPTGSMWNTASPMSHRKLYIPAQNWGHIRQALGAAAQEIDLTDDVAEAQDQAAADEGGDDRGKDLAQGTHDPLKQRLVRLGGRLHRILADPLDTRAGGKLIVEDGHIVADDDLKLSGLVKVPFTAGMASMAAVSALAGSASTNRIRVMQWDTAWIFSPASNGPQKRLYICLILCHGRLPSCCSNVYLRFPPFFREIPSLCTTNHSMLV